MPAAARHDWRPMNEATPGYRPSPWPGEDGGPRRRQIPTGPGPALDPGGIAAHANGSLYVVFGNHAHRLAPDLGVGTSVELPRRRPYNSFVIMPDGHLVTKDF